MESTVSIAWDYPSPFTIEVAPHVADIDGLNHVNNAVYLQWCEQAGWAHSEHLGLYLADYQRLDRAMAIRRGEYDYLLPALLGDKLLLSTWLTASDGKILMTRNFQLVNAASGQTVMRGRWELVCIELSTGKARRMPAEFCSVYDTAVVTQA